MKKKDDNWDEIIRKELEEDAAFTKKEVEDAGIPPMPEDLKEKLRAQIQGKIDAYEKEKVYEKLSEEDREALRLGRELINQKADAEKKSSESDYSDNPVDIQKHAGRKQFGKRMKIYASIAAMLVLVLGIGVTSRGGAERVSSIVRMLVGKREVVQIDSDSDRKIDENEDEEKAYEEIKEEFGVEPVKLIKTIKSMKFAKMLLDRDLQTAELYYMYGKKTLLYTISTDYYNSSISFDTDDQLISEKERIIHNKTIELKIFKVRESDETKCLATFQHKGLNYFVCGYITEEECVEILNNLYFY